MIELRVLGPLELQRSDGRPVDSVLVQPKAAGLLVCLALAARGGYLRRDSLLGMFWPEQEEEKARAALRQALYALRRDLAADAIVTRGDDEVGLNPERVSCDVSAFTAAVEAGALERAVELYRGPFLSGFYLRGNVAFDQWVEGKRERLTQMYGDALRRLAEQASERREKEGAVEWYRRLAAHSPYSTRVALRFMEALEEVGDRASALAYADRHGTRLREDLDAEPSPDVEAYAARLRKEPVGHGAARDATIEAETPATDIERLRKALQDRYAIEREVGRGGMATVYLAKDLRHHRRVATKVLNPELAASIGSARFLREIEITAQLNHPHILPLLDSGEADGFLFYVMPYVEGESLRSRLNREHQLPIEDAIKITAEVADALQSAHKRNVIHRDIKPENVLLDDGHAIVADFGIARAVSVAGGPQLTESGLALGTPVYMSPEQGAGERWVDARSDIYSLGCIIYEMLVGDPPYLGSSAQAIIARKTRDPVPSLKVVRETVPDALERVVMRSLARAPADRFSTVTQFAEALAGALREPVSAPSGSETTRAEKSIAVLPFVNLSADPENEYFSDGMTEEIINALSQLEGLRVAARTSSFFYKGKSADMAEVSDKLKVATVLEGSVRRAGNRLRITAQLIDVADGFHLWSERFDRDLDDVFAVQDEIARTIADALDIALEPASGTPLVKTSTRDTVAYELYLKGRFSLSRLTDDGILNATGYFEQASARDPEYAPPYAGLAQAYIWRGQGVVAPLWPKEAYPKARAAALEALSRDDSLAEAHHSLAAIKDYYEGDWTGAKREYQRAMQLNPSYADARFWYAALLALEGRFEAALAEARTAQAADPLSLQINTQVGWIHYWAGDFDLAISQFQSVVQLDPTFPLAHYNLGLVYRHKGMFEESVSAHEAAVALARSTLNLGCLGVAYAKARRATEALAIVSELTERSKREYVGYSYPMALLHLALGDEERALGLLEKEYEEGNPGWLANLKREPYEWESLSGSPRFQELVRRLDFPS